MLSRLCPTHTLGEKAEYQETIPMDLHHPILREFPEHRETIRRLKGSDDHFRNIFDEYHRLDDEIYPIWRPFPWTFIIPSCASFQNIVRRFGASRVLTTTSGISLTSITGWTTRSIRSGDHSHGPSSSHPARVSRTS